MKKFTELLLAVGFIFVPMVMQAQLYSSCDQWGNYTTNGYTIYNNIWGSGAGTQCLTVYAYNNWNVVATHPATSGIKSYPNVAADVSYNISTLGSCTSSYTVTRPSSGAYNTSYDIWCNNYAYEIMLWVNYTGAVGPIAESWDASGNPVANYTNLTVGGHTWNVYRGSNGSNAVFSFLRTSNSNSGTVDIKAILDWLKSVSWFGDVNLHRIQFGFEITSNNSTSATFACTAFSLSHSGSNNVATTGVTVSPTSATVTVNGTQQLTATVLPTNATNKTVSWSSSNSAIATVSTSGLVTGKTAGSSIITVTTSSGSYKATSTITVSSGTVAVTSVSVSPTSASINVGSTTTLTATVLPTNATNKSVTWSSSNAAIATVSTAGVVTGVGTGSATITVTTVSQSKTATAVITVTSASSTTCSSPVSITIPFSYTGTGEYCWKTTSAMAYVNSWCTDKVTINGVDYTNIWSNTMPAAVNGAWVIYYKGSYSWSHFEAPALKSATGVETATSKNNNLMLYPNPVNGNELNIQADILESSEVIVNIYNTLGQKISTNNFGLLSGRLNETIGLEGMAKGTYIFELSIGNTSQTKMLVIQ